MQRVPDYRPGGSVPASTDRYSGRMEQEKKKKKRWSEISRAKRAAIVAQFVIQVSLLIAALWDIRRRPAAEIRGGKKLWTALAFINYIGPIAYFVVGRKSEVPIAEPSAESLAA